MASSLDFLYKFFSNPFARFFRDSRQEEEKQTEEQLENSQGMSQEEIDIGRMVFNYDYMVSPGSALTHIGIQFEQYFNNKAGRISKYREMSMYPEISDALDAICDEAITDNPEGNIVTLEINEELPKHIEEDIRDQWDWVINDVFSFKERAWDLFRKWLVDGELYVELILNDVGDEIIGIKVLPAHTLLPIYEQNQIIGYIQARTLGQQSAQVIQSTTAEQYDSVMKDPTKNITFDKDQIAYANYGLFGANFLDPRGFLESSIRVYNQLKSLEDSLVVYRLVRAPERRVWNIATGRMPKGKAEEYIKGLIQKYKRRIVYDPDTGAMNSAQNVQSLTEDFWFSKNEEGEGTTVETIGGGMNLGEIEDINYFLQKLYKTLKLPRSRWEDAAANTYSSGKSGEVQREEIKFARFVERLQRRFKYIILDPFLTQLRLKGIDEKYVEESLYDIRFEKSNLFKEYKAMELTEARFALLTSINEFIFDAEANPSGVFSKEFVLRHWFMMTDEEWNKNKSLVERDKVKAEKQMGAAMGGEGGGFAGGGGDLGFGGGPAGGAEFGGEMGGELGGEMGGEEMGGAEPAGGEVLPVGEVPAPESRMNFGEPTRDATSDLFTSWLSDDKSIVDRGIQADRSLMSRSNTGNL